MKKFLPYIFGTIIFLGLSYGVESFVNRFDEINVRQSSTTTTTYFTTACFTGDICRTTWPTGGGSGTYSFTPITIGGSQYQATSSVLYFGMLSGSSTVGTLTSTSTANFLGG